VKGSGTTPRDSSKLRVEVLLKALLVDTSVSTQTISSIYMNMNNNNNARYIERVKRKIQIETRRYISRFEPLLYVSAFTEKDFNYPLLDLP